MMVAGTYWSFAVSFAPFATFTKLQDMITMVNENVGTCYQNYGYCQAPASEYRLGKEVYFF